MHISHYLPASSLGSGLHDPFHKGGNSYPDGIKRTLVGRIGLETSGRVNEKKLIEPTMFV